MLYNVYGLVLRETPVRDNDKFLTLLTADRGLMSLYARGVRNYSNRYFQSARVMCYSEFLVSSRGDFNTLREASQLDDFHGLQSDLRKLALGMYFCDAAAQVCAENADEADQLRLILNALYTLDRRDTPLPIVKGAFELRLMCGAGFMPDLSRCADCGKLTGGTQTPDEKMFLDVSNGCLRCGGCRDKLPIEERLYEDGRLKPFLELTPAALDAMRYVAAGDPKRVFSFRLSGADEASFAAACENYLLYETDRTFKTLDFYNSL